MEWGALGGWLEDAKQNCWRSRSRIVGRCGMGWHGVAWHGVAWHGVAWVGMGWHGVVDGWKMQRAMVARVRAGSLEGVGWDRVGWGSASQRAGQVDFGVFGPRSNA